MVVSDPELALEARDLYRFFHAADEETLALRGVSLCVEPGDVFVVTGPSGSGKSTLMACAAGLDDPDGGAVRIGGRAMSRRPESERAQLRRRFIGVLGQSGNLFSHLTVEENVELARRLRDAVHTTRTVDQILAETEISHRKTAYPHELSGGETTRASLAVALANEPILLLADEPTGELDMTSEASMLRLFKEQASRGVAVVIASHSPAVVAASTRTLQLCDGREVNDDDRP